MFAKRVNDIDSSFVRNILKLTADSEIISFAGGLPNPELFPTEEFEKAASSILSDRASAKQALQYGQSAGYDPLRQVIARSYLEKDNLEIDPELIIITNGSQQALDLLGKVFLEKKDKVAIEAPSYLAAIQALQFYEPDFIEIGLEKDGPDLSALEQAKDAKILYAIVNFQNPSGITWSNEKRELVANFAKENDILLIEDDPYGEIRFEGERQRPLKSFHENTVMLGSFSKILAPGLRLGWLIAPNKEIFEKLLLAKQAADLHTSQFTQMIASKFYENFDAQAHIEEVSANYKESRNAMMRELELLLPSVKYSRPEGGMFLWLEFEKSCDTKKLLDFALQEQVAFVPGEAFFANSKEAPKNMARFNFTNATVDDIQIGIERLAKAYKKYSSK